GSQSSRARAAAARSVRDSATTTPLRIIVLDIQKSDRRGGRSRLQARSSEISTQRLRRRSTARTKNATILSKTFISSTSVGRGLLGRGGGRNRTVAQTAGTGCAWRDNRLRGP